MKELKLRGMGGGTMLFFSCLKDGHVGEITLIHDLRAKARPEVLGRQVTAQYNSLYWDCAGALMERF